MKLKQILYAALTIALSIAALFAKENKKAATCRTYETADKNASVVYFIRDITPEDLVTMYKVPIFANFLSHVNNFALCFFITIR